MRKMKRLFVIILFLALFCIIGTVESDAYSDKLYLDNLYFDVNLNTDGSMEVTETWDIEVEKTNTLYKTFKMDSLKFYGIEDVKVTDVTNGNNYPFSEIYQEMYHVTQNCYYGLINSKGEFEIAWGIGMDDSSGHKKYKIQYTVKDAVIEYSDCAELYWQFVGENFEIDARNIKGTITLPEEAENKEDVRVWGHTEDLNGEIYLTSKNKVEFTVNNFRSGRYVEVRIAAPKDIFETINIVDNTKSLQTIINEETVWANEANARREAREQERKVTCVVTAVIFLMINFIVIKRILKNKEKLSKLEKIEPTQKIEYYREIPDEASTPAEALYLLKGYTATFSGEEFGRIFSATLLQLSLKKLIEFEPEAGNNKIINIKLINKEKVQELEKKSEILIYEFLREALLQKEMITSKELLKYIKKNPTKITKLKEKIDSSTEQILIQNGKIDSEQKSLKEKYLLGSFGYFIYVFIIFMSFIFLFTDGYMEVKSFLTAIQILSAIIAVIAIVFNIKIQSKLNIYTQKGVDEHEQWKGLMKYMKEFSLLKEREVPELVLWEKFLVYATAFGIADKVLKQLKIVYPNIEEMDNLATYTYMNMMIHTDFNSIIVNSITASMSSAYSSASGGGGGFSGGGGGGRWTAAEEAVDKTLSISY